jgi:predicted extracellular nuclease
MLLATSGPVSAAGTGDVVINEIIQNPSAVSDADGEWFEIVNVTGAAIDINGWTIQDNDTDSHVINNGGPLMIAAGGFLVLADNPDPLANGGVTVDYQYSGITLANSSDELVLLDNLLTEIDRVEWDDGATFPDPTGASMSLIDPALDNNVGANWCEATTPFGDGDLGSPGAANDCLAPIPEIVINEIIQNPSAVSDGDGEWFELFNPGGSDVDIDGWTIQDNDTDSHVISNGGPLNVPAGGYLVLGVNGDPLLNGGVTVDYVFSSVFLANGSDELVLLDTSLNEIDRVEWDDGATFPDPTGASMALIDPALDNNVGANWCEASTPFGAGDLGTPGAANDCVTAAPVIVINEIIQNPSAVSDGNGEWFELFNPGGSDVDIDGWTVQDNDTDSHVIVNGGPLNVPAGGYVVLGVDGDPLTNGGVVVDYVFSGIFLGNSSDELVLLDGALTEVDRVEWDDGATFPDPTGASMALIDPGLDNNVGANWCEATTPFGDGDLGTPGAANDCASGAGELVVNEIDYDQDSTDTMEFVELKNVGAGSVLLSGFSLEFVNGSNGSVYDTIALPAVTLGAGDYYVVCANAATVVNCDLDDDPDTNFIQNGSPDAVALMFGGGIVDTVSYEGDVAGFVEGSGSGLEDSPGDDNSGISRFPDGVDTDMNNVDLSPRCITPGEANSGDQFDCPVPGPPQLVVNEIDYDQPSSDFAEFVEIFNAGNGVADLTGVTLELVNGSDGLPYDSVALPSVTLFSGEFYVVCADALAVPNCDLEGFSSVQNGSPDAVALMFDGAIIDTVSYEGDVPGFVEGSGSGLEDSGATGEDNKGISRVPNGVDTDMNNVDLTFVCVTPGSANTSATTGCGPAGPVFEIFEIQGSGSASPFDGQSVTTEDNVVTAVGLDGFFIQTPTARTDGDVDTSDGIFVFTNSAPTVAEGDLVDVTGLVQEFFDFTEISAPSVTISSSGNPLPAAVVFDATVPSPDPNAPSCAIEFECYEGMLVEITGGSVTGPHQEFGGDPIAEVHITAAPMRTFREPGIEFPGEPGFPVWDGNPEVFELDNDALGLPNDIINAGSTFDAVGVIGFEFGGYELFPKSLAIVDEAVLPRPVRARTANEVTVGSLNLFRLFDDVDDPSDTNFFGETRDDTVVSTLEYDTRRAKFVQYIMDVLDSPDVLAVQEAEKLGVLEDLAADIAAVDPAVVYTAHLLEGNDIGTIDVGFLVRDTMAVDSVTQLGLTETYIDPSDQSLDILHDRPPLLLEGRCLIGGAELPIQVMVVHNRSLSGIDGSDGLRVRQKRFEQAQSIAQKVQDIQTADPGVNLIVTGDFNAFEFSDSYVDAIGQIKGDYVPADNVVCDTNTCDDLVDPNLTNLVDTIVPVEERYSFNFSGNAQVLDHALVSESLLPLVSSAEYGRGNADGAEILIEDDTTPIAASDHDGLVVFLSKDSDGDGVVDGLDFCPDTVIPESVPTRHLGPNRWALVDDDNIFDTPGDSRHGFTTEDTAGCSCEQIIVELGLGHGHVRFGCSTSAMLTWVNLVNP